MEEDNVMVTFDIESLFTNVPLDETIEIILDNLFMDSSHKVLDITKEKFKDLLHLATKECFFTFNEVLYQQVDGVAMGNPLGPTIANAFLANQEKKWLSDCPAEFKPSFYRRYVDDIFMIFKRKEHVEKFLEYMNKKHRNIKFSSETEKDGVLAFLGVKVSRTRCGYSTSVFKKPTFTGLYTHVDSFVPNQYKTGLINILLHRAFMICSNFQLIHQEFENIKMLLARNGFGIGFINSCINRLLNKRLMTNVTEVREERRPIYVKLPFTGKHSLNIRNKIRRIVKKSFPTVDLRIAFYTLERIGSRFQIKDRFPDNIASNIVYKFQCRSCNAMYVGKTRRHFGIRRCEHLGITPRLRKRSTTIPKSAIFDHKISEGHIIKEEDFSILDTTSNHEDLDIKEALYIYRLKPKLNVQQDMASLRLLQ